MFRYAVRRALAALPVLLLVSAGVFTLLYLTPGDPAAVILGPDATTVQIEELRGRLGLNDPWHEQMLRWYGRLIRGDLGQSLFLDRPVTQAIRERAEPTIMLTLLALLVSIVVGMPTGVLSALKRGRLADTLTMLVAIIGVSMPTFWLGLNLIYLFGVHFRVLPVAGYQPFGDGLAASWASFWEDPGIDRIPELFDPFGESLRYLVMPAITLGLAQAALLARMTRSMMLETLGEDYVRTARAKGLSPAGVVVRHALRNALIPLVTVMGLSFAVLLGGAVITEQVFNIPGVGRLLIQGITRRDYPVVQGVVLVIATSYVLINLVVDIVYGYLDPRLRQGRA
ncbi:MAG: ABC transporter permease [Chloroflexi bacterium]|nr:ABC transporter permease [Chloroflexota bacterium]